MKNYKVKRFLKEQMILAIMLVIVYFVMFYAFPQVIAILHHCLIKFMTLVLKQVAFIVCRKHYNFFSVLYIRL